MMDEKYRKKNYTIFFGMLVIVIFCACVGNTQKVMSDETNNSPNNQRNTTQLQKTDKASTPANKQYNVASLQLIDISSEKAVLEFSNKTDKAIYLFYEPNKTTSANSEVFYYWFRCKEKEGKEVDYNKLTSHIISSLEPLERNEGFHFEVNPLPRINADCKVSILYYDDERAVNLINNKSPNLNKSEYKFVENAKKSVELQFQLNNE